MQKTATAIISSDSIIGKGVALKPGEIAEEEYPWLNKGEKETRMKVAKITYYEPWDWVIGAGAYKDEIETVATRLNEGFSYMMSFIFIMGFALVVIGSVLSFFLSRGITDPISRVISGLKTSAEQVTSASGQLSFASQQLAEGTTEQAASLEEDVFITGGDVINDRPECRKRQTD